jgi:hypothetical protein
MKPIRFISEKLVENVAGDVFQGCGLNRRERWQCMRRFANLIIPVLAHRYCFILLELRSLGWLNEPHCFQDVNDTLL